MSAVAIQPEITPSYGWSIEEVLQSTGGSTSLRQSSGLVFQSIVIDSRNLSAETLFVALHGENHDGHDFVAAALQQGASAAIVDRPVRDADPSRLIQVSDTLHAFGDLAAWARRRRDLKVVGITGSNGKTTTKDLIASICAAGESAGLLGSFRKTQGNFNNLIGLPLTLLALRDESIAVLEMGMNRPGEIARLTEIADPDFAVVTNIGAAHLAGVGGTIEGVARAKAELFAGMSSSAEIAVNLDDALVARIAESFRGRRVTYGSGGEVQSRVISDLGLDGLRFELRIGDRTAEVRLALVGAHNVSNALAAAAIGHLLGLPIEVIAQGLNAAVLPPQRMQVLRLPNGVVVINDAYNAILHRWRWRFNLCGLCPAGRWWCGRYAGAGRRKRARSPDHR